MTQSEIERIARQRGGTVRGVNMEALASCRLDGDTWVLGGNMSLTLPVIVVAEMNRRDHWAVRQRRFKKQGQVVTAALMDHRTMPKMPCQITLTKIGNTQPDSDNLASGFKAVRDAIAKFIGTDDGDPRLRWAYCWEPRPKKGQCGIRIDVVEV